MTLNQSALLQSTDALRTADGGDVMRQMLGFMLQALVDAEATSVIGAAPMVVVAAGPIGVGTGGLSRAMEPSER